MKPEIINADFFQRWETLNPVDLILTDPPYNILSETQAWDILLDWSLLESIFSALIKPAGIVLIFCDLKLMASLLNTFGEKLRFKHYHIWRKPGGMPVTLNRPISNAEFILLFRRQDSREKDLTWNPELMGENGLPYYKRNNGENVPTRRMKKGKICINENGNRYPKTVIDAPSKPNMEARERTSHPAQKPETLLRRLIRGYSNEGDTILDPFAGSGSTLVSAYRENRKSLGFEINETYYREAVNRINAVTNQVTIF